MVKPPITKENMLDKEPTKNILNLLAFYHEQKRGLQQKHFLYALGNLSSKQQSHDPEAERNKQKLQKFFKTDLQRLYDTNLIQKGIINTPSLMTYYLNELANLGVIKKEGIGKNTWYLLKQEFFVETIRLQNLTLIDEYNKEVISFIKIKPNNKEMQEMFPDCSIFLYGLGKLNGEENDFVENKFEQIEKLFSEIMTHKMEKLFKITIDNKFLEKVKSKKLKIFFRKAKQDTIQHFFMCLVEYFMQDVSAMDKDFFSLDHFYAWIYMIKEGGWKEYQIDKREWEKYKEDYEKFFNIIKKYKLKDNDLKEALKLGVDMFYGYIPLSIGFSLFYSPTLEYGTYIKKITELR